VGFEKFHATFPSLSGRESAAALVSVGQQRRLPLQVPPLVENLWKLGYAALPVAAGDLFA
jgi:hypothetical protein